MVKEGYTFPIIAILCYNEKRINFFSEKGDNFLNPDDKEGKDWPQRSYSN